MENLIINHWAVIVAAVSMFLLGGLWYGPLFGKAWAEVNGLSESDIAAANPAKTYGFSFIIALAMAYNLAAFLGDAETDAAWGATAGFLAGFGWVALSVAMISLFEQRRLKYVLINGGYIAVAFTIMGFIIGGWR